MAEDINDLAAQIKRLGPSQQLRLVADMLERIPQLPEARRLSTLRVAHTIVERISLEMSAVKEMQSSRLSHAGRR